MTTDAKSQEEPVMNSGENMATVAMSIMVLAIAVMVMVGSFHVISGIAAILDDDFYAVPPGYELAIDAQVWGVVHLLGGCLAIVVGVFLLFGVSWARTLALVIAVWSAIWSFYSIPYYPTWSWMILVLDAGFIWALLGHWRELRNL